MTAPVCPIFLTGRVAFGWPTGDAIGSRAITTPNESGEQRFCACLGSRCAWWDPDPGNATRPQHEAKGRCGIGHGRNFLDPAAPPVPLTYEVTLLPAGPGPLGTCSICGHHQHGGSRFCGGCGTAWQGVSVDGLRAELGVDSRNALRAEHGIDDDQAEPTVDYGDIRTEGLEPPPIEDPLLPDRYQPGPAPNDGPAIGHPVRIGGGYHARIAAIDDDGTVHDDHGWSVRMDALTWDAILGRWEDRVGIAGEEIPF